MILAQAPLWVLGQSSPTVVKQGPPIWTTCIPVIALAFTIGSFWWIYARRGRLKATAPKTYASFIAHQIGVRLPIVFHNTGARAIAVTDLRLVIDDDAELEWENTRKTLMRMRGTAGPNAFMENELNGGRTRHRIVFGRSPAPKISRSPPLPSVATWPPRMRGS